MSEKINVTVIIKALNEEKNIANCLESVISALRQVPGKNEIILVDSGSEDLTVEIAKKYPVRIFQLRKSWAKSAAAALNTGYLKCRGKYVYVLDGDMILKRDFIKVAMRHLQHRDVAGVGGLMKEGNRNNPTLSNVASIWFEKIDLGDVDCLDGGGLYKRQVIDKIGYLADPWLNSSEESDLCFNLKKMGYKLLRINKSAVIHFTDIESQFRMIYNKFKTGYLIGNGQVLRKYLWDKFILLKYLRRFVIYMIIISFWITGLVLLLIKPIYSLTYIVVFLFVIALLLIIKKRNIMDVLFSFYSWNITSLGLIKGFLRKQRRVEEYPQNPIVIKELT